MRFSKHHTSLVSVQRCMTHAVCKERIQKCRVYNPYLANFSILDKSFLFRQNIANFTSIIVHLRLNPDIKKTVIKFKLMSFFFVKNIRIIFELI